MKKELTKEQAVKFLESCEWRAHKGRVEVNYDGHWLGLCRTDYADDVATTTCGGRAPEEELEYYLNKARRSGHEWFEHKAARVMINEPVYGYISHAPDYVDSVLVENVANRFSIIDAFSDG